MEKKKKKAATSTHRYQASTYNGRLIPALLPSPVCILVFNREHRGANRKYTPPSLPAHIPLY